MRDLEFLSQCEELLLAVLSRWCPLELANGLEKLNMVSEKSKEPQAEVIEVVSLSPAGFAQE